MSRPPKPLSQITPESAAHNKGRIDARLRASLPQGKLGAPSKWMSENEKKIWRRLAKYAPSQLGESDRPLMEIAVTLKAKLEARTIENAQITQLVTCLTKLGMIPVDRAPVEEPKPEDPLDRFKQ